MALPNIIGLLFPLGAALALGAIAIGLFYRAREVPQGPHDNDDFRSDFHPEPGFDTRAPSTNSTQEEEEKCCICLEGMSRRRFQCIRTLPCAHKFHKRCVENWLRYEMFCPSCRTVVAS